MTRKDYNYKLKSDAWYDWRGVKPPERTPNMTEDEMMDAFKSNIEGHTCKWRQNGAELQCDIGNSVHGTRIGPNLRLAGTTAEGKPILKPFGAVLRSDEKSD